MQQPLDHIATQPADRDRRRTGDPRSIAAAAQTRTQQRRALVAILVLNFAAIGIDVGVLDEHLAIAVALRLMLVFPIVLLGLALNCWSANTSLQATVNAVAVVVCIASVAAIGEVSPEPFAGRYMMAAQFFIFTSALLSGLPWRHTQIMTVAATGAYALIVATGLQWPPKWANLDLVGFGIVMGAMALRVRKRKDEQIAELELIRSNDAQLKKQLREASESLGRLSTTDSLTGAFNRRYLDELIAHGANSVVPSLGQGVLMVDVDHFKLFNDHSGHAAGDRCLQQIVATIRDNVRPSCDIVVRYGGEEFAVILPGMDEAELRHAAERLCRVV
ncbi:GGDEF domain-containing protein, partial [Rhodopseudomonas palustris]